MSAVARIGKGGSGRPSPHAGTGGLLGASNFVYQGSFRLPQGLGNSNNGFQFYGYNRTGGVAYNPANNSLFLCGSTVTNDLGRVCELSIPQLVQGDNLNGGSTNLTSLFPAGYIQTFVDVTTGKLQADPTYGNGNGCVYGMLVSGGFLYVQVGLKFDNHLARVGIFRHGLTLSVNDFFGWETVWDPNIVSTVEPAAGIGYMQGCLSDVPSNLQASLGGTAVGGANYGMSIIGRTSQGPSAFIWTPSQVGSDTPSTDGGVASSSPVTAQGLLYYTPSHATLGDYQDPDQANFPRRSLPKTWWSWGDCASGGFFEDNTYFVVQMFGHGHATNPNTNLDEITGWYGDETTNWTLNGTVEPDGQHTYAYDTSAPGLAQHAWPYEHRVVFYKTADLLAVKAGANPWTPVPYGSASLPLPFDWDSHPTTGGIFAGSRCTYDRANRLLYVVQVNSVDVGTLFFPMVHVFHVTSSL